MSPYPRIPRRFGALAVSTLAAAVLAACGGGDGGDGTDSGALSSDVSQGYAADAVSTPVHATDALDSAVAALESGMVTAAAAPDDRAQALALTVDGGTSTCGSGGTVQWTVTGGTDATRGNRQLDAGETLDVTYLGCGSADGGPVLDGQLRIAVAARSATGSDVTLTATALRANWAVGGSSTLNGSSRRVHSEVTATDGSRQGSSRITSSGITLATTIGARLASYQLNSLDWTIVRSFDAGGAYVGRTHQGSLDLAAATPRRPNATLQVSTQGATSVGSDGWVSSGGFVVVTARNRITCTHGGDTVTLALDRGDDGTVDVTWTLTRTAFQGEAG